MMAGGRLFKLPLARAEELAREVRRCPYCQRPMATAILADRLCQAPDPSLPLSKEDHQVIEGPQLRFFCGWDGYGELYEIARPT